MLTNYQHPSFLPSTYTKNFLSSTYLQKCGSLRDKVQGYLFCPSAYTPKTACETENFQGPNVQHNVRSCTINSPCQRIQERVDILHGYFTAESGGCSWTRSTAWPWTILQRLIVNNGLLLKKRKEKPCFLYPSDVPELISITCQEPEQGWVQRLDWRGLETAWQRSLN